MPLYTYRNKCTGEFRDVFQSMKETHEYFGETGDQDYWERVYYPPNFSIDSNIDPFSQKDFMKKTANKKGTIGDIMDKSAELSEKRAAKAGEDPIKKKYFNEYAEKRRGARHPKEKKKTFENKHVKVEFD